MLTQQTPATLLIKIGRFASGCWRNWIRVNETNICSGVSRLCRSRCTKNVVDNARNGNAKNPIVTTNIK